jgi:hypothetical protein
VAAPARESPSPFDAYHRARRASMLGRVVATGVAVAVVVTGFCLLGSVTTAQAESASAETLASITTGPIKPPTSSPTPTASAGPAPTSSVAPAVPTVPSLVRITITATGYQHELDACQWVRMDLGAEAPIVGAHTRCGGSVVLALRPGETVELRGQGLDGRYVVTDGTDAHAGDDASTATQGMRAQVILQTCYPGTGGRERLVGLEPWN